MSKNPIRNAQTASQFFEERNKYLENEFMIYGEPDGAGIKLLKPEKVSSVLSKNVEDLATADSAEVVHITKASLLVTPLANGANAEANIINKNGIFDTLIWTTTPDNIKQALRDGLFEPAPIQNWLAKLVAKLGQYKQLVFKRSLEEGFVVKHNVEKLAIVDFTQDCIEALQPLYESINNVDGKFDPQQNLDVLLQKLANFSTQLTTIKNSNQPHDKFNQQLYGSVDLLIDKIEKYKSLLVDRKEQELKHADVVAILRPYANPLANPDLSLQHFMQEQLNTILSNSIVANYTVSGLFQDYSGLQKIITDTQVLAENFSSDGVDYHHAVTAQHVFDFSQDADENGLVTMDMRRFGVMPSSKLALAKYAALIKRIDDDKPLYCSSDKVYGFFGINWNMSILEPAIWIDNGVRNIIGTIADVGYLVGKAAYDSFQRLGGVKPPPVNFPSGKKIFLKKELSQEKYIDLPETQKIFNEANPVTKIPHFSLLQKLYSGATTILSRYVLEPVVAISDVVADEFWHLKTAQKIWYDSTIGTKPVDETAVGILLNRRTDEIHANEAANEISHSALIESFKILQENSGIQSHEEITASMAERKAHLPSEAIIPYHLTPDRPRDLLNFIFDDLGRDVVEFFSQEVYRGHPITGLAFSVAAGTAAPMIVPSLGNYLGLAAINQNISVPIAKVFIGETSGLVAGVSTALLQGKIAYLAMDIFNGRNSLLSNGVQVLLENPVIATVVTTAAISFGYVLAYDMNVPWLSEKIASETSKASFPYFELGLSGAKVAAILVEGTLNLHHEQDHLMGDHFIDNTVDNMREEITIAMRKGYLRSHNIAERNVTPADVQEIEKQVTEYCDNIKSALKKPAIAEQVSQLSHTIGSMIGIDNPASFNGVAAKITDEKSQAELALFLQRREKRHQIASLNPKNLSEKDKYIILNYLAQTYPDDLDYVASVRDRFEKEAINGWFGETLKIVASYFGMVPRAAFAGLRYVGYQAAALGYSLLNNLPRAKAMRAIANNAANPARELGRKVRNDLGLLLKAGVALFRDLWGMTGGVLLGPMALILAAPIALFSTNLSAKMFARINRTLFAPGRISQFIDMTVGMMRADAGSKNLALVTQDVDIRASRKIFLADSLPTQTPTTSHAQVVPDVELAVEPLVDLESATNGLIKNAFAKHATLRPFVKLQPKRLQSLISNLEAEIVRVDPLPTFFIFSTYKSQFKKELKSALLEVHANINELAGVSLKDKLAQQKVIIDLLQANKYDPIIQFIKAYEPFTVLTLPGIPNHPALQTIYGKLTAAHQALLNLRVVYDDKLNPSRAQVVADFIAQHSCLSLQSVREITRLQKTLRAMIDSEKNNNGGLENKELAKAEKLLEVLMVVRRSARNAAVVLSGHKSVFKALTTLHIPAAPALPAPASLANGVKPHGDATAAGRSGIFTAAVNHVAEDTKVKPASTTTHKPK